jgi:hypothetical protein
MKKLLILSSVFIALSCGQQSSKQATTESSENQSQLTYYGEKITPDSAVSIDELSTLMGDKAEMNVKLTGKVDAVCQKKGCWMDLKKTDGNTMRVTFKDYGFFMPKDGAGKTATIRGVAKIEETSVADLQEYAKDAGKSKEEIASIKEPKKELVFEADGVILQ